MNGLPVHNVAAAVQMRAGREKMDRRYLVWHAYFLVSRCLNSVLSLVRLRVIHRRMMQPRYNWVEHRTDSAAVAAVVALT